VGEEGLHPKTVLLAADPYIARRLAPEGMLALLAELAGRRRLYPCRPARARASK
jgi:hypothetical protein